mgnify:CR=1 FL=1
MPKNMIEELREIFEDRRLIMSLALVRQLEVAKDRSVLRVKCTLVPDNVNIVARMSWSAVGPDAGVFQFPSINDLVIVGYVDGDENQAYVISRCTSKEDKLPLQVDGGHLVMRGLSGKKTYIISNQEIQLCRGGADATEKAVMGTTFQAAYSQHLQVDATHTHIGNLGYQTTAPNEFMDYLDIKSSPVDDGEMLSDLIKVEK